MADKTITIKDINGVTQKHIVKDNGDGNYTSFPVDDTNPEYIKWVAEGNTPD